MANARRLRLMLTGFFATIGVLMLFNFVINPLGAWQHQVVPGLYRRVRLERVITPYLLRTSAPQTLLLGSSRVLYGMKIEQGVKGGFQNAAFSGSHLPEIAREVDIALRNPHLKRVIWGVEFYTFDTYGNACSPDTCARLDGDLGIKITDSILSADALVASWRLVLRAATGNVTAQARMPIPWPAPYICDLFAHPPPPTLAGMDQAQRLREVSNLPEYRHFDYSPRLLKSFLEIVDRIRRAHVELIAFVPPVSEYELEMIRQTGRWTDFQQWKRDLAAHLSYADFSGYNGIARSDRMFIDAWHMEPAVGAVIMRQLLGLAPGACRDATIVASSALPVTADNVDQMLALQQQRLDAAVATPNIYSTTIAAVIVKRYGASPANPSLSATAKPAPPPGAVGSLSLSFDNEARVGFAYLSPTGGTAMPSYVILFHLTHQGLDHLKGSPDRIDAVIKTFERHGAKVKDFYAMMGQYDSMFIVEAPDDETVARLALGLGAQGNVRTETHRAFSLAEYRAMVAKAE